MLSNKHKLFVKWCKDILVIVILAIIVGFFWIKSVAPLIPRGPEYNYSEIEAISKVNFRTIWTWTDYKSYHRYSPTGLLLIGLLDRHIIAPLVGIDFSNIKQSCNSKRLLPLFFISFILISLLTYWFSWKLFGNRWVSFISALYIGVNKAFFYFFYYTDTLALSLLLIYGLCSLIFWKDYLDSHRNLYLIGYYLFFLLCVGAWEQWVNLLSFIILFTVFLSIKEKKWDWQVAIHGMLIPLLIFFIYVTFRFPSAIKEISSVKEAQYVFSYPAKSMMIEDMVVNASLHISDTIDSLLFPWPMLSQSVIHNYNMNIWNPFNKTYAPYPSMHYRFLTDWYAGFLFCLWLIITILFIIYVCGNKKEGDVGGVVGILLVWTGFIVHLPVMYRAYFAMPGYFLGYKHIFSILGFSIFLGWTLKKFFQQVNYILISKVLCLVLSIWIVYCNYSKIVLNLNRFYPW